MAAATEEVVTTRIESHTAVRRQVVSNQMTIGGVMEKLSRGVNARIELPFVDLVFPKDARSPGAAREVKVEFFNFVTIENNKMFAHLAIRHPSASSCQPGDSFRMTRLEMKVLPHGIAESLNHSHWASVDHAGNCQATYCKNRGLLSIRTIPGACTYSWRDQLSGKCVDDCLSLRFELEIDHEVVDYVVTEEHTASVPAKRSDDAHDDVLACLQAAKDLPELSDFTLICDGQRFPCNKFMLGARSEVFRAMFAHTNTVEAKQDRVVIKDSTPEAVKTFLQMIYTGQADVSSKHARFVYGLADKYMVPSIKTTILKQLIRTLGPSNAAEIALMAHLNEEKVLLDKALLLLKENLSQVQETPEWKLIEKNYPLILSKMLMLESNEKSHT